MLHENDSVSSQQQLGKVSAERALEQSQQHRQQATTEPWNPWEDPIWDVQPPDFDAAASVQQDLKLLALIAAVNQVSQDNNRTIAAQMDVWNYGRGVE